MEVTPIEVLADDDGNNTEIVMETGPTQVVMGCFNCDASIEEGWGTPCIDTGSG